MGQPVLLQRLVILGCALLAVGLLATGCGGGGDEGDTGGGESGGNEGGGVKIALLLPKASPLYESEHRSAIEKAVEEECGDCEVLYSDAGNDPSKQRGQAEAALEKGAEVLVVDPVNPKDAATIAAKAKAQNVPVVSYDRLIEDGAVDAYVAFDDEKTGEVQAEALVGKLEEDGKPSGPILMVNGPANSSKAARLKKGAKKVFEQAGVKILREYDIKEWRAEYASREVEKALADLGKNGFAAVYAADNNTAAGAISPLRYNNLGLSKRPVTGDGATFDAVQRVMTDEQFMTTYNEVEPEATAAAEVAVALAEGEPVPQGKITDEVNNGKADVPSVLLEPVAITTDNFKSTVIADGLFDTNELCEFYEYACDELKISYTKKAPS